MRKKKKHLTNRLEATRAFEEKKKKTHPTTHNRDLHAQVWQKLTPPILTFLNSLPAALLKNTTCTRPNKETVERDPRKVAMTPPSSQTAHTQFSCLHRAMAFFKATTLSIWWSKSGGGTSQTDSLPFTGGREVPAGKAQLWS